MVGRRTSELSPHPFSGRPPVTSQSVTDGRFQADARGDKTSLSKHRPGERNHLAPVSVRTLVLHVLEQHVNWVPLVEAGPSPRRC